MKLHIAVLERPEQPPQTLIAHTAEELKEKVHQDLAYNVRNHIDKNTSPQELWQRLKKGVQGFKLHHHQTEITTPPFTLEFPRVIREDHDDWYVPPASRHTVTVHQDDGVSTGVHFELRDPAGNTELSVTLTRFGGESSLQLWHGKRPVDDESPSDLTVHVQPIDPRWNITIDHPAHFTRTELTRPLKNMTVNEEENHITQHYTLTDIPQLKLTAVAELRFLKEHNTYRFQSGHLALMKEELNVQLTVPLNPATLARGHQPHYIGELSLTELRKYLKQQAILELRDHLLGGQMQRTLRDSP